MLFVCQAQSCFSSRHFQLEKVGAETAACEVLEVMSQPTSPTAGGGGGAEVLFGQILQTMQANMMQMSQESQQRFELLERGLQDQARALTASSEAQVRALEVMSRRSNVVDVKGVGKPEVLKGSHETARKSWKSWCYKFESWFVSQYPGIGQDALDWAKGCGDQTIQDSDIQLKANAVPELRALDGHLHVALVSLTSEMPYTVVFNARKKCGLDAWRKLCHLYEPHNPRSNMRLLRKILVQPRCTLDDLRAAIDRWEADVAEYVSRGNKDLEDEQKVMVIMGMTPEGLEDHLELNISQLNSYAKVRSEIISYTEQKAAKKDADSGGAAAMDLDAFKGKSKGKGKSRDGKGGNPDKDLVCHYCQKKGHRKADCWSFKASSSSSQSTTQKAGTASKGKDGKGKRKGKDKGKGKGGKGKAHALEGEGEKDGAEGQERPEDEPEKEGNLGVLFVAGGTSAVSARSKPKAKASAESARLTPSEERYNFRRPRLGFPSPVDRETKNTIIRPEHATISWFWSRPLKVVQADCRRDKSDPASSLRCPVPNCKGYYKSFDWHGLSCHCDAKMHTLGHPLEDQWQAWEDEKKRGYYIRPTPYFEEEALKRNIHCAKDPIWIHLPREPDYSKHSGVRASAAQEERMLQPSTDEEAPEEEGEEEEEEPTEVEADEDEASEVESQEEQEESDEKAEEDEDDVEEGEYEADEVSSEPEAMGSKGKSAVSAPSSNRSRSPLPRRRRQSIEVELKKESMGSAPSPSAGKYVPPHLRPVLAPGEAKGTRNLGRVSLSTSDPYAVNNASRAIVLGDLLSKRIVELEEKRLALDDPSGDRATLMNEITALELEIQGLKEEQKNLRVKFRQGYSARQEVDKKDMGGRLAYLKEGSRKRAAKKRLQGQSERTEEKIANENEWRKRFDREGSGQKRRVFPLAQGVLANELEARPLSKKAKAALLEEEEKDFLELKPVKRTRTLPLSARAKTPQKQKAKHKRERRREQRRKEEKEQKGKGQGPGKGTGNLASFSGQACTSTGGTYPGWTRVDFVIDSGASATTIPKGLVGKVKLEEPVGYHSFKLADGSMVPNEGTLSSKAWLLGDEMVQMTMSVANIAQPLLSVGQLVSKGNKVVLSPKVSYVETKTGRTHRIFLRNGVYVLPLWMESSKTAGGSYPFEGQGLESP